MDSNLASRFACVVDWTKTNILFSGRYDECCIYLSKNFSLVQKDLIDLRFATDEGNGMVELGCFASFVIE